ncbi:MAG: hypothetical protein U0531_14045 [Dehalococcoidia bacterium]
MAEELVALSRVHRAPPHRQPLVAVPAPAARAVRAQATARESVSATPNFLAALSPRAGASTPNAIPVFLGGAVDGRPRAE